MIIKRNKVKKHRLSPNVNTLVLEDIVTKCQSTELPPIYIFFSFYRRKCETVSKSRENWSRNRNDAKTDKTDALCNNI